MCVWARGGRRGGEEVKRRGRGGEGKEGTEGGRGGGREEGRPEYHNKLHA